MYEMMPCKICGQVMIKSQYSNAPLCSSECFTENFWREAIEDYYAGKKIVICHHMYVVGDENDKRSFRGYGGKQFYIYNDDTEEFIATTNLWSNGPIPEKFWDDCQDNAKFISKEEYDGKFLKNHDNDEWPF